MKNLQELEAKYIELGEEIKKLKSKRKLPEIGMVYFIVTDDGCVASREFNSNNLDLFRFYSGNFYITFEDAEKALKKQLAYNRIMKYIIDNDLNFEPDWNNTKKNKSYIYYDYKEKRFLVQDIYCINMLNILPYFEIYEQAKQVIDNCESDLKKIFDIN